QPPRPHLGATMISTDTARMLTRYKAWANDIVFATVSALPEGEATRSRATFYDSMVHTLHHVHVIDRVFQAHLEGREHGYTARNTATDPPLAELWAQVQALDRWYIELADRLPDAALAEPVEFRFIGGGDGTMTRGEILLHLVNHATYHRGFVGDMLNQAAVKPRATDLTVFLRDAYRSGDRERGGLGAAAPR
ncbi:MAG TPA: DinB family protein, partial [Kofleriaceae bacterium]|nr:DinB family protein [Kofleriaceae bacterium]